MAIGWGGGSVAVRAIGEGLELLEGAVGDEVAAFPDGDTRGPGSVLTEKVGDPSEQGGVIVD